MSWLGADLPATLDAARAVVVSACGGEDDDRRQRLQAVPLLDPGRVPASFLVAPEAAALIQPPSHDVLGLPCRRWARFDEHPEAFAGSGGPVELGATAGGAPLRVPTSALLMHMLISGNTGVGKSTLLFDLLEQLHANGIPYLVIEPTKSEYASAGLSALQSWAIGSPAPTSWRLNPLEVPDGTPVQHHVERLVALFRASFGMVDPLPYLLEEALHEVYERRGWDLASDTNVRLRVASPSWPTLTELLGVAVELPSRLGYPPDVERTVAGAFRARLGSLLRGPKGVILDTDEIFDIGSFLATPMLVNLDLVGDDEVKAFFMGLLMLRLGEARQGKHTTHLRHVMVIEEAHRLLRRDRGVSSGQADLSSNASGHATEAIANYLSEIRSSGEGVIVVDQAVSLLASQAIANTAIKIAFRSTERADKAVLASSMNLDSRQADALTALNRHEAAVWWEGMDKPVRARMRARFPAARVSPQSISARRAGPLAHASPEIASALRSILRTRPADSGPLRAHLERLIADEAGSNDNAVVQSSLEHLIKVAVDQIGQVRHWTTAERDRATWAVVAGADVPEHPSRKLLDGRRPFLACNAVCVTGGCLVGDAVAPAAERMRGSKHVGLRQLLAAPEERRRRSRREILAVFGPLVSGEIARLGSACLAAQSFDELVDPDTIAGIVADDEEAADG